MAHSNARGPCTRFVGHGPLAKPNKSYGPLNKKRCNKIPN